MVDFLKRSRLLAEAYTHVMAEGLLAGKPFSALLADLSFADSVVTQIALSEVHGQTQLSLQQIQSYLLNWVKIRKKLIEVATYPAILLLFLLLIMLGLKEYLLPQLEGGNAATLVIEQLPTFFFTGVMLILLLVGVGLIWYRRTEKLRVFRVLASLPLVGSYVRLYLTAYYAREWGSLISQGLEMSQIVALMSQQASQLFQEMGRDLQGALANGQEFHTHIQTYSFFKPELSLMVEYGQAKSKLGSELAIYASECWEEFFSKVHRAMQLIQPLIFLFVALVVVLIYAAMLLPIYHNMEM